jgi:hypothetical protein
MATNINEGSADLVNAKMSATLGSAGTAMQLGLNGAMLVHKARLAQQQRYAAEVEQQYGAQDAGVKAAQAKLEATTLAIGRLTAVNQQATTPAPAVTADDWVLQGRVYSAAAQPIAALTVFLVDGDKIWQRQYGFSYTDETGLFLLQGAMPANPSAGMFIEIANSKGQPIYIDSASFAPVKGQAVYKSITLTSESPLGDPPQPIRVVGLPNQDKSTSTDQQ